MRPKIKGNRINKVYDKALEDAGGRYIAFEDGKVIRFIDARDYAEYASKKPRDRGAHEQDIVEWWEERMHSRRFSSGASERIAMANEEVYVSLKPKGFDYGSLPCNQRKY